MFEGNHPFTKTKVNFDRGDVKALPATGIMPWKDSRFMMNTRSTILYEDYFRTPAELILMMTLPKESTAKKVKT